MAAPKKGGATLSPEIIAQMDNATARLFELAQPHLEDLLNRYIMLAQKPGNEEMLINLIDRLAGKSAPRVQPEQDINTTINILTHGGDMSSYRLSTPGKAIDIDYDEDTK